MTRDELLELIAAAEKATKGPWSAYFNNAYQASWLIYGPDRNQLAQVANWQNAGRNIQGEANATHIANCDPDTIIELARLALECLEWRAQHNGYNPAMRAVMPELKEPASPKDAIRELAEEAVDLARREADELKAALKETEHD